MNWIKLGRVGVRYLTTASVGTVVLNVVKATIPKDANAINKIGAAIGGFILSDMAGAIAADYVDRELAVIFAQAEEEEAESGENTDAE